MRAGIRIVNLGGGTWSVRHGTQAIGLISTFDDVTYSGCSQVPGEPVQYWTGFDSKEELADCIAATWGIDDYITHWELAL